jgi:phage-related minor tail protein
VFDLARANRAAGDEFQTWIDKKYLDPNNPAQYAAAVTVMEKKLRDTADAAAVAGSKMPQLTALMNDAGNLNKQFDAFATTSVNAVTPALIDMFNGTTTLSNGFKSLGLTIVKALEDAIIKITIIKPLIQGISGLFGGGFGDILGSSGITYGTPGTMGSNMLGPVAANANGNAFGGSNVIPFRRGGAFTNQVFSAPTFFQFRNGGAMANGVMAEAGEEAVMPLRRGSDGRLGVSMVGGSGASGGSAGAVGDIYISVNVPEGTGADDASAIADAVKSAIVPVIDERISYHSRARGMLNNAA